jgi:hypothetical protein
MQAARDYLAMGWQPIPVPLRSKNPNRTGWEDERWTLEDVPQKFFPHGNIGVLTGEASHGLIDLDLDCAEAVALAPAFLPPTGFKSGRASNPYSHYWYLAPAPVPKHEEFIFSVNGNGKKSKLLELRSNGHQTVVPPSLHQDTGEQIVWHESNGVPATVMSVELSRAARELAAATLLTQHYPQAGSRHDFALAFSGFLLRNGWNAEHVSHFLRAVAEQAGDEEISDREKAVETTAEKLAANEPASGGPSLRELLGSEVFQQFCNWLGFTTVARFTQTTIEADNVPADEIPLWPVDTLEGDFVSDLTFLLYTGTSIPPQYLREGIVQILAACTDGKLGFPRHADLPGRRFLALISERAGQGKGESWKRLLETPNGALLPLLGSLKVLDGSGIGSGQYLAKVMVENPHAVIHWDEASKLFQVTGQQSCSLFSDLKKLFDHNSHWTGSLTNGTHGTLDAHLSVSMHSTHKIFTDGFALRSGMGDGLLSRFTLVYSAGMPVVAEWEPRNFAEEKKLVAAIGDLIPIVPTVPEITEDARQCMKEFILALGAPDHPYPDHVRRLSDLVKTDILARCIYSATPQQITLEMVQRGILWGQHQLALRLHFWPADATDKSAAMTKVLLKRLERGTATARDLRIASNCYRDGTHELFTRALSNLTRSGEIKVLNPNKKGFAVYGLEKA